MDSKKGFLLLELMGALFLLTIGITLFLSGYELINNLIKNSQETFKKTIIAQNAIELSRHLKKESLLNNVVDNYTVETRLTYDQYLKNFLHIEVTVYDSEKNRETWFSGVAVPYEE